MKLPTPETTPEHLVLLVNEAYYDSARERYHEEIGSAVLREEGERWRRLWRIYAPPAPRRILDIGTGSGFVPLALHDLLDPGDRMTCSDLSAGALEVAERNLSPLPPRAHYSFRKLEGSTPFTLPFDDGSFDVVGMNSVLHHVSDVERFLGECRRVLRPGGLLILGHEPNSAFRSSFRMRMHYRAARALFLPRQAAGALAEALRIDTLLRRLQHLLRPEKAAGWNSLEEEVNQRLAAHGVEGRRLSPREIAVIVDIRDSQGFDPRTLPLQGFRMEHLETYNHLMNVEFNRGDRPMVQRWSARLARLEPERGATFTAVFRRVG